jgi:hypothetical protein
VSWRDEPETAGRMFAAFGVLRNLHELLYFLDEALALRAARGLHGDLREAFDGIEDLASGSADGLLALDIAPLRRGVGDLLDRVSALVRAEAGGATGSAVRGAVGGAAGSAVGGRRKRDRRGADLVGAVLAGADLRGTTFRGALLIGADLSGADLRLTDLLGADLRGADIAGADLRGAIFLTQSQVDAAHGDAATRLSGPLTHPAHWPSPPP